MSNVGQQELQPADAAASWAALAQFGLSDGCDRATA